MPKWTLVLSIFFILALVLASGNSIAGEELQPGDKGYRHGEFHESYQKFFDQGRCNCSTGECRATEFRPNDESLTGIQVKVEGKWCDVSKKALIQPKDGIPPQLWGAQAHVCAYDSIVSDKCPYIECAVIIGGV